ncbi:stage II sporulation protein M [Nocardia noduli]|uniref:stage II sporulation protein M n=1 Tax=Nocardia noduli TaxID=2815722 RepID=UPI001C23762F|nr:stage II sporulation protein M [Nocardia noduli]
MDVDAYSLAHRRSWERLDHLAKQRKLSGPEADELIVLYRRTSQQLARLQSHSPDPQLIAGLSAVLTRARGRVLGTGTGVWAEIGHFLTHSFPVALYRSWRWWAATAALFVAVSTWLAIWIQGSGNARELFGIPTDHDDLTAPGGQFETYYTEHPNDAFAAQVWTNNAWVAAIALFTGVLILPVLYLLFMNALNVGITAALMAEAGRLDAFFGFILPHGTLELTAVFVAGGAGIKLGWTLIDPGRLSRLEAVARQGRATATIALGLVGVLFVSGLLEGFVTPSGLPVAVRIAIGFTAEALFLYYVFGVGGAAAREEDGEQADLANFDSGALYVNAIDSGTARVTHVKSGETAAVVSQTTPSTR